VKQGTRREDEGGMKTSRDSCRARRRVFAKICIEHPCVNLKSASHPLPSVAFSAKKAQTPDVSSSLVFFILLNTALTPSGSPSPPPRLSRSRTGRARKAGRSSRPERPPTEEACRLEGRKFRKKLRDKRGGRRDQRGKDLGGSGEEDGFGREIGGSSD
jgi:hypothetical protein